jgi:hypothetical protein
MSKLINALRNWLGINKDMENISKDMHMLLERIDTTSLNTFELFHALPFASGILSVSAKMAAAITEPGGGIQANSLAAILTGIVLNARQGNSVMEVNGELSQDVRDALTKRGFVIEDSEGQHGKSVHILWT